MEQSPIDSESDNSAAGTDDAPSVYQVKRGVQGWQLNRREFLAAASVAALAAGSTLPQAVSATGYVQVQVLTAIQPPEEAGAMVAAAVPTATPIPKARATPRPTRRPAQQATFVEDVTIPDKTVLEAKATFTKTWRLKNAGSLDWGEGAELAFVSGEQMEAPPTVAVTAPPLGETVDVSVPMVAPADPGIYKGEWRMRNKAGELFGDPLWVIIIVGSMVPIPAGEKGSEYTTQTAAGVVKTWTQPCGSPIPPGAVCTCNCVSVPAIAAPAATVCSCDQVCTCDQVCSCDAQGHYWYPN